MGVAGLFSFLRRRYPEIVEQCAQQAHEVEPGQSQCDNLYIDLNHIIHACTHPSWREEAHSCEEEQFMEVDVYLDRLVGLMRPTRLLLVAMDGVAPTAKMNQQRGRRFYASHLERQRADIEAQVRREMSSEMGEAGQGVTIPGLPAFDGNVITPGTAFMSRLAAHLRLFFRQKLASDPDWQQLAVVFSDSSEPGEGEHKLMRFIRQQRLQPDYDPNTRHCIYGQDADLILLALLSHEPHFSLLREAGTLEAALAALAEEGGEGEELAGGGDMWTPVGQQPLELLRISTLRDFLRCEFADLCGDSSGSGGGSGGGGGEEEGKRRQQQQGQGQGQERQQEEQPGTPSAPSSPASIGGGGSGSGGSGGSRRGRQEWAEGEGEGEVDLITGERKKVHPSVARRRAKQQRRQQQEQEEQQQQEQARRAAISTANADVAGAGSSSGTGGGGRYSLERILDDVVFCTFLAGNDFLPHVPSLDIYDRPSALETLLNLYKEMLSGSGGGSGGAARRGGYLTDRGRVDPDRLCWLFARLGAEEEATFQQREVRKVREQRRKLQQEAAAGGAADPRGSGKGGRNSNGSAAAGWMGGGEWINVGELAPGESLDEALAGIASGGNPECCTSSLVLLAGSPAHLRRELLRRVKARMDDRAQAAMTADPVRLALPGYRARYYQKCFGVESGGKGRGKGRGSGGQDELEREVRRIVNAYCRTLCWVMSYYCCGSTPVDPATHTNTSATTAGTDGSDSDADSDSSQAAPAPPRNAATGGHGGGGRAGAGGRSSTDIPYASWQCFYEHHYAPLASDLAKYGWLAMKGALAAASRPHPPIQPFAQLMSVLPFSSMPSCLPPLLARAAADPQHGLLALHADSGSSSEGEEGGIGGSGSSGGSGSGGRGPGEVVFPEDVGALVDLSGKKWAHTAVVRLPFPDVEAITGFVRRQLSSEECHLSREERQRNACTPALLMLSAFHPLAPQLLPGEPAGPQAEEDAVAAAGEEEQAEPGVPGSSILSLLISRQPTAAGAGAGAVVGAAAGGQEDEGGGGGGGEVLCLPLDLAGQHTPPFSPGLLPGVEEGEPAVTMQSWNKRKLAQQRRQAEQAAAGLRGGGGGQGRGRGRGRDGGRGGGGGRGAAAFGGGRGRGRAGSAPPFVPQPPRTAVLVPPRQQQQRQQRGQEWEAWEQEAADAALARKLQQQLDEEAAQHAQHMQHAQYGQYAQHQWDGGLQGVPPAPPHFSHASSSRTYAPLTPPPPPNYAGHSSSSAGTGGDGGGGGGGSWKAPVPPPPNFVAAGSSGWSAPVPPPPNFAAAGPAYGGEEAAQFDDGYREEEGEEHYGEGYGDEYAGVYEDEDEGWEEEGEELLPWLAGMQPPAPASQPAAPAAVPGYGYHPATDGPNPPRTTPSSSAAAAAPSPSAAAAEEEEKEGEEGALNSEEEVEDLLAMLGVQ